MANAAKKTVHRIVRKTARARLRAKRAKANPSGGGGGGGPRANPPILSDFTHVILPGFGAYAVTRFLQRIAYTIASKRWPKLAKHIHALSGVTAFGASWFALHRIKGAAPYHDGILVGSGVAALQGVAQAYLPKYAWMTSDITGANAPAAALAKNGNAELPTAAEGDEYSYLEDDAAPARARTVRAPRGNGGIASTLRMAAEASGDKPGQADNDLMEELGDGETLDDFGGGIFNN